MPINDNKTIEQEVAAVILQKPETIRVGIKKYRFNPPTTGTIIATSAAVSKMPRIKLDDSDVLTEVLRNAKDCEAIGEALATLLCGSHGYFSKGLKRRWLERRIRRMSARLLENHTPIELKTLTVTMLAKTDLARFFELSTFLTEINLTKATKVETTASGQPSGVL